MNKRKIRKSHDSQSGGQIRQQIDPMTFDKYDGSSDSQKRKKFNPYDASSDSDEEEKQHIHRGRYSGEHSGFSSHINPVIASMEPPSPYKFSNNES